MSAYKTIQTKMTDLGILKRALEGVKPEWKDKIETAAPGKTVSIQGDTTVQGELVVRKNKIGTYGDIGVIRNKDGTFSIKVSDVDNGSYFKDADRRAKEGKLFDQTFFDQVQQEYSLVEGVIESINNGAEAISEKVALNNVPGLTGKVFGVRMAISRERAKQLVGTI
jgi:hypothetical protein